MVPRSKRLVLLAAAVVLVVGAACAGSEELRGSGDGGSGGGDADTSYGAPAVVREAEGIGEAAMPYAADGGGDGAKSLGGLSAAATTVGPSVIKTAELEMRVPHDDFETIIDSAVGTAGNLGGFVLSSNTRRGEFLSGTVSIRVPSSKFEQALGEIAQLGKVKRRSVSGQDVGQEFVDLEARLRNWRTQEAVILRLMDRATTISDTIRIQSELSQVQLEIEQIRGRLNYLRDQTSFGTITASFVTGAAPAPSDPNPFVRAWRQAIDTMVAIGSGFVLSLGVLIPLLVLLGLGWLVVRQLRPKLSS